ncbi:MAG: 2-amino-4-hydroxy-6-hydroxymethyldihydropteridine diphosphokinase [Thermoplasmatota archaeon]
MAPHPNHAARAFVAVGASIDPIPHIQRGLRRLHASAPIRAASRFYRTPPLGPDGKVRAGDPEFVNGMVQVESRLAAVPLLRLLHRIEAAEGRTRSDDRHAPRTLDLDLVVHGGRVLDGDLPHRRHLAACLLELEPAFEIMPGTPLCDPGGLAMAPVDLGLDGILAGAVI